MTSAMEDMDSDRAANSIGMEKNMLILKRKVVI
jgi:hypothetical protein